jgi:hypothetical protein
VTRSRIVALTPYALRITFDTAARETPARSATSRIVAGPAGRIPVEPIIASSRRPHQNIGPGITGPRGSL